MTDYTRPATWQDVLAVVALFEAHHVEYALIGGYAIAAHGYVRFTEDVDLLVDPSPENSTRWIAALSELPDEAAAELVGEEDIFQRLGPYAIRINDEFTVDILPAASGHGWEELSNYITTMEIDGHPVRVLSLEGLLLTKEGMRDKDKMDAKVLRAAIDKLQST